MSYIQLLTFFLCGMYLSFIAFEGEDNKSTRAWGFEAVARSAMSSALTSATRNQYTKQE